MPPYERPPKESEKTKTILRWQHPDTKETFVIKETPFKFGSAREVILTCYLTQGNSEEPIGSLRYVVRKDKKGRIKTEVEQLMVDYPYRRKGIASSLISIVRTKHPDLELSSLKGAQKFHKEQGFKRTLWSYLPHTYRKMRIKSGVKNRKFHIK